MDSIRILALRASRMVGWFTSIMTSIVLSSRIRNSLTQYGERPVVEDAGGQWNMSAAQLLCAGHHCSLEPWQPCANRPIVSLSHQISAVLCIHRLFVPKSRWTFARLISITPYNAFSMSASQLAGALILCDNNEKLAQLHQDTEHCLKAEMPFELIEWELANEKANRQYREASYYIATSGSTGVPKLVQVFHDQTIPFIDWAVPFYEVNHNCRWGQFSSIGFDLSLVDFLTALCGGATLVSLSAQIDRIRPARAVLRSRITHWHSVPSLIPYFSAGTAKGRCRVDLSSVHILRRAF